MYIYMFDSATITIFIIFVGSQTSRTRLAHVTRVLAFGMARNAWFCPTLGAESRRSGIVGGLLPHGSPWFNRQQPTEDQSTKHWPVERNQKEFPSGPRRPEAATAAEVAEFTDRLVTLQFQCITTHRWRLLKNAASKPLTQRYMPESESPKWPSWPCWNISTRDCNASSKGCEASHRRPALSTISADNRRMV